MITISRPNEWDALMPATRGVSHRSTTSSRRPGKAIEGSVAYEIARYTPCRDCGSPRRSTTNPHAPRWHNGKRIDCAGREVAP